MFSEYAYCIALDCDEFSRYLQTSASDTAISSYILTPQGQIAAHSDSSRNQTWDFRFNKTDVSGKYQFLL